MSQALVSDLVEVSAADFAQMYVREHPVQISVAERFGVPIEEVFAAPQPYMGCLETARLCYAPGSGLYGKGYAEGGCAVDHDRSWFWSHFIGDPVMAGTLGTDGFLQLGFLWGSMTGRVPGCCRALGCSFTFDGQILPSARRIFYRVDIKRFLPRNRMIMFDGTLAVDDPEHVIYRFGESRGGWYTLKELGIPAGPAAARYHPDWERCSRDMAACIARARTYYTRAS